ncbi:MAG: metal-sensing transcriptional repressor [Peptococcaceae bacterium]|nr:metal-sensing transcriptional repressor [Peptococcaceae bacterium]
MQADKEKISRLLKTARGQLDGLLKMVEEDRYCIDISNQLMAAESILRKANREILQAHLEHCVKSAFLAGDPEEENKKIDEIVQLLGKII